MTPSHPEAQVEAAGDGRTRGQIAALTPVVLFLAWAAVVAVAEAHHEFWRDEVRALSMALQGRTLLQVPAVVQGDGHPLLWYVLLRLAHDIIPSSVVLPALSLVIAAVAVALFCWRAPFPALWKLLFLAGLPLFEYSVMVRNYGVSMLLFFVFAWAYGRRQISLLWLGVIAFVLAQSNVHSALLVPFLLALVCFDRSTLGGKHEASSANGTWTTCAMAVLIAVSGIAVAFVTVYPPRNTMATDLLLARGRVLQRGIAALIDPGEYFFEFGNEGILLPPVAISALLFLSMLGLWPRKWLFFSALGGLWTQSLFFALIYGGGYRHEGVWLSFVTALYWIKLRDENAVPALPGKSNPTLLYGAGFSVLIAVNAVHGVTQVYLDYFYDMSKSKALAEVVEGDPSLANAVMVWEPDYIGEALPYYLHNDSYRIRAGAFGTFSYLSDHTRVDLDLADVMRICETLKRITKRPVILVTEWDLEPKNVDRVMSTAFGWHFSFTARELEAFRRETRPLPLGGPAILETFYAYVVE